MTYNERESQTGREILCMKEMVVMYAGLCDGDDTEIVYCFFFRGLFGPPVALSCPISHSNRKLDDGPPNVGVCV